MLKELLALEMEELKLSDYELLKEIDEVMAAGTGVALFCAGKCGEQG